MKKLALIALLVLIVVVNKAFACSVSINDKAQKNLLIAHGASHLDIALTTVSDSGLVSYVRSFEGADEFECPQYLITSAKVSFKYRPSKFESCDASVIVTRRLYMGDEFPAGPMEQLSYSSPLAACSTSLPRPIPRPCIPGYSCR